MGLSKGLATSGQTHAGSFCRRPIDPFLSGVSLKRESFVSQYTLKRGLWWAPDDVLVLPDADALRQEVLHEMHDPPFSGHVGIRKTRKAVERLAIFEA